MDAELALCPPPPPPAPAGVPADPRVARAAGAALRLARELDALRDARRRRERARAALERERAALAADANGGCGAERAAEAAAAQSALRERIQSCDQRLLAAAGGERAALEGERAAAAEGARAARARADAAAAAAAACAADCAALRAQLRGGLRGVERALAQGGLAAAAATAEGLRAAYAEGLARRRRAVERQVPDGRCAPRGQGWPRREAREARVPEILPSRGNFTQCWLLDTISTSKLVTSVDFSKSFDKFKFENRILVCISINHWFIGLTNLQIFFMHSIVYFFAYNTC